MEKVKITSVENLSAVKVVLSCIKHESGTSTYQGADLKKCTDVVAFFKANHPHYCDLVQTCLKDRLATQETDLLSQVITILATQGWEKDTSTSFAHSAIQTISARFQISLEQVQINVSVLEEEWNNLQCFI